MQAGKPGGRLKEGEPPPQTKPAVIPLTSQQIQQLLEDNAVILKAIQEAQNLGRVEECEKYVLRGKCFFFLFSTKTVTEPFLLLLLLLLFLLL